MTDTTLEQAAQLGAEHGTAATSTAATSRGYRWRNQCGHAREGCRGRLRAESHGDGFVLCCPRCQQAHGRLILPEPDLTGDYTIARLYRDCGLSPVDGNYPPETDAVVGAYEAAFRAAVEATVRARYEEMTR